MNDAARKRIKTAISISLSLFFLTACTGVNTMFRGNTVYQADRIYITRDGAGGGVWSTDELSVHYTYATRSGRINLTGYVAISNSITATYSTLDRLSVFISFLDADGRVLSTRDLDPVYFAHSPPLEKITFEKDMDLTGEAASFCFSYSGEFRGDDKKWDSLSIGKTPFY